MTSAMEIEIKVRLAGRQDYEKVATRLAGKKIGEEVHDNHFFDGLNGELSRNGAVFRLRLKADCAEASIKAHGNVEGGTTLRFAEAQTVSLPEALQALQDPSVMLEWPGELFGHLKSQYACSKLKALGHFRNYRIIYRVGALAALGDEAKSDAELRLDLASYPFGELFEIEMAKFSEPVCFTFLGSSLRPCCPLFLQAHDVHDNLTAFLSSLGATHQNSNLSKFQRLAAQSLQ
eukprot:NODE_3363_length_938_cov_10.241845_g2805_i0.p1 GENE.NODE_3363_length_938_cov_10.241845_g2805_i0~~NODE_3363_length_938_cov_10.241845_g2805_i0.p1  ORF type:complete len:233 (+),score=46.23 NODE_3363_length_938_cov_10.241845_g2805_i0:149-847(+)